MKLNYKKTILVGFAFFLISAFWQAYDTVVPMILTYKFDMKQLPSGIIMSLDNVLAVVMLPLFGAWSDKVNSRYGKRTPFIFVGTILAAICFTVLGFINILGVFILVLLCTLISMATFRSPAVALMPDVTIKPLRSKGNAIINLMGTAGGIIVLGLGMAFNTDVPGKTDFGVYIIAISALMIVALIVFLLTVKEPLWAKEMELDTVKYCVEEEKISTEEKRKLTRGELRSLILILASVVLWYVGYNAVTSKYSVYASTVLEVSYAITLTVAQVAAVIAYIPVGIIASKIGRKKTILAGIIMLTVAFGSAAFIKAGTPAIVMYLLFCLAGIGWATINVNSFPMVVELAKAGDVGKYTGFYYTASMSAQIITPILSGAFVDAWGWWVFFPYATVFVGLAFVTMFFVKHGDAKPTRVSALEALGGAED